MTNKRSDDGDPRPLVELNGKDVSSFMKTLMATFGEKTTGWRWTTVWAEPISSCKRGTLLETTRGTQESTTLKTFPLLTVLYISVTIAMSKLFGNSQKSSYIFKQIFRATCFEIFHHYIHLCGLEIVLDCIILVPKLRYYQS